MQERARVKRRNCRQATLCEAEELLAFFCVLAGRIFGYGGAASERVRNIRFRAGLSFVPVRTVSLRDGVEPLKF
jgi:hypothetical protein